MITELVSVVVGVYNGEKFIRAQMDSIIAQTYRNLEIVVIDDASTDNTLQILQDYAFKDNRIHIHKAQKNIGVVANFERGLGLARGEFIALSDQDDVFRNDKIEVLVNTLKANPKCDLVVSDLTLIDSSGGVIAKSMWKHNKLNPKSGHPFRRLVCRNFATGCAMMIRQRLLDIALPFPADCLVHDWWLAVAAASERAGGLCLIDEPLVFYRQHASNVIGAGKELAPVRFSKLMSSLKSRPNRITNLAARNFHKRFELPRLEGYLSVDTLSSNDQLIIEQYRMVLNLSLQDGQNSFIKRLFCIPERLRYAFMQGNARNVAEVVYWSLFPHR